MKTVSVMFGREAVKLIECSPAPAILKVIVSLPTVVIQERPTLLRNGVQLRGIGRIDTLPDDARAALAETERLTAGCQGMHLRLALSYGSRSEIADALKAVVQDAQSGALTPEQVDEETLRRYLYDPHTPDPDLLIRTAGEMRVSNFLLWQISYSEIYIAEECWPAFRTPQLHAALRDYAGRVRKFGGLISDTPPEPKYSDRISTDRERA